MNKDEIPVVNPTAPKFMNVFEWNNSELQKWIENAVKMQQTHVNDNNLTEFFRYKPTDFDAIQLRICIILFGMKLNIPKGEDIRSLPVGTLRSMLKTYSWAERRRASDMQKKISNAFAGQSTVDVNCIFVSVAFPKDNSFVASENPVFVMNTPTGRRFMDAGGRIYQDWDDYLRNNHLNQGVMIYPDKGTYTPDSGKVNLIANETHSCKPSARAKDFFDLVCVGAGLLLSGVAVVTAVPLITFSASTLTVISTGSYWIGLAISVYPLANNLIDKLAHQESVRTEMLIIGSNIFSGIITRINQSWNVYMANLVRKVPTWEEATKNITKAQKFWFACSNLLKIASTATALISAIEHLWVKPNRTWLDYYQLCISFFFFANTLTKPIFLQGLFESEQNKYFDSSFQSISEKIEREEAKQEYGDTVKKADTAEKKFYLIRNLLKIEDIDGHFYRIHTTGSVVEYTEKGMVINNQITISPEAYNQMGKEQLLQELNDIKNQPSPQERTKRIERLVKDYESDDFKNLAQKYVDGTMTAEEKTQFDEKIKEMSVRRKDQLFKDTTDFKNTKNYRDNMTKTETDIAGGKNLETLKEEKSRLKAAKDAGRITDEEYNTKINEIDQQMKAAERARDIKKAIDRYVQTPEGEQQHKDKFIQRLDKIKGCLDVNKRNKELNRLMDEFDTPELQANAKKYVEQTMTDEEKTQFNNDMNKSIHRSYLTDCVNANEHDQGKRKQDWQKTYKEKKAQYDRLSEQDRGTQKGQKIFQIMEEASRNIQSINDAVSIIDTVTKDAWVTETRDLYKMKGNYETHERFTWHVTNDATKSAVEEIWGVTDYRTVSVNGRLIFKDMDIYALEDTTCIISSNSPETIEEVKLAMKLAEDQNCKMKVSNARDFRHLINAAREAKLNIASNDYNNILNKINTTYTEVDRIMQADAGMPFVSINSAVPHTLKHMKECGPNASVEDYLKTLRDTVIKPENSTGAVYTQFGTHMETNYGETTGTGRYRFAVTRSGVNGEDPKIVTMFHKKSSMGQAQQPNANQPGQQNPAPQPGQQNPAHQPGQQNPAPQPGQQNPAPQPGQQNPAPQPASQSAQNLSASSGFSSADGSRFSVVDFFTGRMFWLGPCFQ